MAPESVNAVPVTFAKLFAPRVMFPAKRLVAELLAIVPPFRAIASAVLYVTFLKSVVAPLATVTPLAVVPSALLAVSVSVPALTVVAPV